MVRFRWFVAVLAAAIVTGCDSFHGPGVEYTAPKISGRLVDDKTGQPVVNARVGRQKELFKPTPGEWRKGGEDLLRQHDYVRTDADGRFVLPSEHAALLFWFGDIGMNLDLATQHRRYGLVETNLPYSAIVTNSASGELEVPAGDWRLSPR
jgi:hypothetical protein